MVKRDEKFVLWFKELGIEDVPLVGGKNASLGEMYRNLTAKKVAIPNGFAITAYAYHYILEKAGVKDQIKRVLSDLNTHDMKNLSDRGAKVRKIIENAKFPKELEDEIVREYRKLCKFFKTTNVDVAVRSSATAEDLPDASFAGQQETYLNIRGANNLIAACKKCFASLFTNRAISYREDKKFDHFSIGLSIAVQKMVRSDKSSSGVMFSIDTESGFPNAVFLTSIYGLGENIVQGAVNPDEFYIFKPTLKKGFKSCIISKKLGSKHIKMVYTRNSKKPVKNIPVPINQREKYAITDDEAHTLAKWACIIEDHYSKKAGHFKPMDMEWAKDGVTGKLYIVQARPETVHSQKKANILESYVLKEKGNLIAQGSSVGEKIASGPVNVIKDVKGIRKFKKGEILVTEMTDPDWEPIMKIASAIVTDRGGRTCHAAIISRELGIPCIVGTKDGTHRIKYSKKATVDCSQGSNGYVYDKELKYQVIKKNIANIPKTKTKVMMNLGNPEQAFDLHFLPNKGVGLAREEFIINSYIKVHPLALLHPEKVKDEKIKKQIAKITKGYKDKSKFFVDQLASGVATLASAFYPHDVVVRMSDFKSNEYANLIGGHYFEPSEDNPMIGWRGASRYYDPKYAEAFGLECRALRRVRDDMGLKNVIIMIPFCRTVEEGKKVLRTMEKFGLKRKKNGLKVYAMCEIPANVILADQFLDIFDGFSIGSNDLTQLTLGLDRDSELVSKIYDERNEAVKILIRQVIEVAKRKKKHMGFCGDAPSSVPGYAEFLVSCGIESLSVTPDAVINTILHVAKAEEKLRGKGKKKPAKKKVVKKKKVIKKKPALKKTVKRSKVVTSKVTVRKTSVRKRPTKKRKK
ncbi:phosphoenolpyruvate synthase [archaeon]|nr:phosphoenolpyruvate synthase [archaeon]MBT4352301.1 phosphoenolpyruvate synthase [archaeon]MBT4647970.1 phosphoenolpyruvate synthase [archaeon]MBT7391352.1 phosphoenolpyruvate synthase [archaeon]